jgi:hypothetical protein
VSRHLYVSCDRCGVLALYKIAQRFWHLGTRDGDLCPPCVPIVYIINKEET